MDKEMLDEVSELCVKYNVHLVGEFTKEGEKPIVFHSGPESTPVRCLFIAARTILSGAIKLADANPIEVGEIVKVMKPEETH